MDPLNNLIKACTVEDALRAVGQAHARLGVVDPWKDGRGGIVFCIQRPIKAYKKYDDPPKRMKPILTLIVIYIMVPAYGDRRKDDKVVISDLITIAFFFLLRPGG
jgi:hypothetical protein